ncbi:MAG: hypothetical protein WBH86_15855 [Thermogutta sp.]|nr:hypothetical protein [Thermogutta sp.]HPU06840.1 hypothetical protein [Thermogutta sp.]HQF13234.1 hypothetical protein [Thermogutta sp.]
MKSVQNASRIVISFLLAGAIFWATGCGSGGPPPKKDDSRNPASHAQYIKNLTIRTLKKVPNLTKDEAVGLLQNMRAGLAQYEDVPMGEFEATYKEIVAGTEELLELCRQGGDKAQIKSRADALIEKANTLPGELEEETTG